MNSKAVIVALLIFGLMLNTGGRRASHAAGNPDVSPDRLSAFARCLTEKGWALYSSFTCPACRAQLELFGDSAHQLNIVECNPHAPDSQVQQCLDRKIRYTPTWLRSEHEKEIDRHKGYQDLEALAAMTGCSQ